MGLYSRLMVGSLVCPVTGQAYHHVLQFNYGSKWQEYHLGDRLQWDGVDDYGGRTRNPILVRGTSEGCPHCKADNHYSEVCEILVKDGFLEAVAPARLEVEYLNPGEYIELKTGM
jgi:hypothetical protein